MEASLTATERVFGITELCNAVIAELVNLEFEDIFRCTLVNRHWRQTILNSPPLRQKLFLDDAPLFQDTKAALDKYGVTMVNRTIKPEIPITASGRPKLWLRATAPPNVNPLLLRLLRNAYRDGVESLPVRKFYTLASPAPWMSGIVFTPVTEVFTLKLSYSLRRDLLNPCGTEERKGLCFDSFRYPAGLRMSDVFAEVQKLNHELEATREDGEDWILTLEASCEVHDTDDSILHAWK